MNAEEIRSSIEREFPKNNDFDRNDISFLRSDYLDYEGNQIADFLYGKKWDEITLDMLLNEALFDAVSCLCFLKPKAFCYYLATFLNIGLDLDGAGEISDALCDILKMPRDDLGQECKSIFMNRMMFLNLRQKRVVCDVLNFLAEQYEKKGYQFNPAVEAFDSYWITV